MDEDALSVPPSIELQSEAFILRINDCPHSLSQRIVTRPISGHFESGQVLDFVFPQCTESQSIRRYLRSQKVRVRPADCSGTLRRNRRFDSNLILILIDRLEAVVAERAEVSSPSFSGFIAPHRLPPGGEGGDSPPSAP